MTQKLFSELGLSAELLKAVERMGFERASPIQANTESFLYSFNSAGDIATVLLRRQVNGGAWSNVRQAVYTYHSGSDSFGSAGDLKLVEIQLPAGSGWTDFETTYYRYYTSDASPGFVHGLKFVLNPAGFQLMIDNGYTDPTSVTDSQLLPFSDSHFEYAVDTLLPQAVSSETVYRGSQTFTLEYEPVWSIVGGAPSGPNTWYTHTRESRPDGSYLVVLTNPIGQPLLKDLQNAAEFTARWTEVWEYDSYNHEIQYAHPSAVASYSYGWSSIGPPYYSVFTPVYHASAGLIEQTNYYPFTVGVTAPGYVKNMTLQQGSSGTPILQSSYTYSSVTVGGLTVNPIATKTVYRDTAGLVPITTSYARTYYSGTVQVQNLTTTLPAIATGQNGSGVAATNQVVFDTWGRPNWEMDERGYITFLAYDQATGGPLQRIDDVNTSLVSGAPAGWSTPTLGGLNLYTDFEVDNLGRKTRILYPTIVVDIAGVATTVRRARWFVYQDATYQTWTAEGFATGTGPDYTYFMYNPVSITITDAEGRNLERIAATRGTGLISSGPLLATDSYPQSSYVRWTTTQYLDCCFVASRRVYYLIPTSGEGTAGVNYDQTDFGYDIMKRRYRTVTPGGTITDLVFETRGLVVGVWVGTDDTGATPTDPSGGGTSGNNMVQVTANAYDGGADQNDGNLTQVTQYVDGSTTRVTTMTYDFRNRQDTTDGEINLFQELSYDNLNEVIQVDRYDTTASGNLIGRTATNFDDQGRVYQTLVYAVDPSTGTVGNSLTSNMWYDASGNLIKEFPAGSQLFVKTTYDSLSRATIRYTGYGPDSTYADALSVIHNTILEQDETVYDNDNNVIQTTNRQRYHNADATQTGALMDPGTNPKARVEYVAVYPDAVGRTVNVANYGTNGGTPLSRPSTAPARSDTILVNSASYDITGMVSTTTDPAAMVICASYDAAARTTEIIENCTTGGGGSSPSFPLCTASDDTNRTTQFTYTPDSQLATQVVINAQTGNQTTAYAYGTTLTESAIATSILLRFVDYPDSTGGPGGTDSVALTYNRQSQRTSLTDQRGCVHDYIYDLLARQTNDCVTTLGTGVDNTVLQLATAYEVRGMISELISYASATPGTGTIVNDVQLKFNSFGQLSVDAQSHSGAVGTGTPEVQYGYADGSANTVRPTSLTFPNGRVITTSYGTSGGTNDSASRVDGLIDDDLTALVNYAYLGLGVAAQVTYPEPGIQYTLLGSSSGDSPAGDIYWGLDLFGRNIDSRWFNTSTTADVDRIKYGYDRASNRTWRENPVATAAGAQFDEFYDNDGLHRLKDMQRGTLNGSQTGITSPTLAQCWTLDPTGNWPGFNESTNGSTWRTTQTRTANAVNEITGISTGAGVAYDAAGNMTTIPQIGVTPTTPTIAYWETLTVDDWASMTVDQWAGLLIVPELTATYDAWNRMTQLTDLATGNTVQQNQYDARNFRTMILSFTGGSLSETRHSYFSSDWRCIEERTGSPPTMERQFVWGIRYIDDLVLRDRVSERLYALQDANWNVTSLVGISGAVQERYGYMPYGDTTCLTSAFITRSASLFAWETTFCGYRMDFATSVFAVRNRYFHPRLGTWISRDPLEYDAGLNQYLLQDPLNATDPYGMEEFTISIAFHEAGDRVTWVASWWNARSTDTNLTIDSKTPDWDKAIIELNKILPKDCINNVIISGHGSSASIAGCIKPQDLIDPQSGPSRFLAALKKRLCVGKNKAKIDIRCCEVAKDAPYFGGQDTGKKFLETFAALTNATVTAIDDWYAIVPHGHQFTASPGRHARVTAEYDPYKGSWIEWINNRGKTTDKKPGRTVIKLPPKRSGT